MPRKKSETSSTYTDLTTLGSGGMAKVFKAQQESLKRMVAIKELKAGLARDPSIVSRFEREARYAAALQHESIVHIYDYFREKNSYYIVMEYVDGTDLGIILKQVGALPPDIAAICALRLVRALEHAHSRGVIHRDIKPANALVSRFGEVKLSDFGIAKDPTNPGDDMTQTGQAVGTPSYMSPEQILGDPVDYRTDTFSLGIVLYEMLTGQKPFVADNAGALLDKIRTQKYRDPRSVNRATPRALAKIIRRSLHKEPRKRWSSTTEMRRALEAYTLRHLRVSPEEHLRNWLYRVGIFAEKTQALNLAAAKTTPQAATAGTRARALAPRIAFAGLAGAAALGSYLLPSALEGDGQASAPSPANTAAIAAPSPSPTVSPAPAASTTPLHEEPPIVE